MRKIFEISKKLMNLLKYRDKFILIFATIALLVAGVMYLLLSNLYSQIEFNAKENLGVRYIRPLKLLLTDMQNSRYESFYFHQGDIEKRGMVTKIQQDSKERLKKLNKIDFELNTKLKIDDRLEKVSFQWNKIIDEWNKYPSEQNYKAHTDTINNTIALIAYVNDTSNLILDPDLDTFYLMDAFGLKVPDLMEKISLAKIELMKSVKDGKDNKTELIKLSTLIEQINEQLKSGVGVIYDNNSSLKPILNNKFNKMYEANTQLINILNSVINDKKVSIDTVLNITENSYANTIELYEIYAENLYSLIEKRVKKYSDQIPISISFTLLIFLLIGYIFIGFYFSVVDSISLLVKEAEKISNGDLTVNISLDTKDEIADLSDSLNKVVKNLGHLVNNVVKSVEKISTATDEMYASADQTSQGSQQTAMSTSQLAQGAQEISTNVDQGANTIDNMNKVIQEISRKAIDIAKLENETEINANEGSSYVQKAVGKINNIKAVAGDISTTVSRLGTLSSEIEIIVDLIKSIAGQTNLLALNAAIEAARAGEHGKGFAVVAEEVKKLATQSAEATDKITSMIKEVQSETGLAVNKMDKATNEVEEGVTVVNDVGTSLKNIIKQVTTANHEIQGITREIEGLAQNSESVVRMVENISAITEETAASAEEISSITEEQSANSQQISANSQILTKISEEVNKQLSLFKI